MKAHTQGFKDNLIELGREIDLQIEYNTINKINNMTIKGNTYQDENAEYPKKIKNVENDIVFNQTNKNLLDFNSNNWTGCVKNNNDKSTTANLQNQYYSRIIITELNEFLMQNRGNYLTFSINEGIPEKYLSIVIFGTRTSGQTYQEVNSTRRRQNSYNRNI